ncbi:MAG: leucine-rich repeat domain-containing protein [Roseburia sp.]|nr:leucine-rich repeat domain-containing protein [Roseburia sp.]
MKNERRKTVIFIIFVLATVFAVAAVIAVSVYELKLHKHAFTPSVYAPTCTEKGYTLNSCGCGYSFKSDFVDPLGHDYAEEFTVDLQPDCTNAGSKSKHCSRCESKSEVIEIQANGHAYGGWSTVRASTCTESGEETRNCSNCGGQETQYPEPLGHDIAYDETDEYYHSGICSRCTNEVYAKHDFNGTVCTACAFEVHPTSGLEYELNDDGASYKVTGMGTAIDKDIVIFSEYNGLPVTEIGYEAFYNEKELKSVCMYGIEKIGTGIFTNCASLEKVVLPATLNVLATDAFRSCHSLKEISVDKANPEFYVKNNCLIETDTKVLRVGTTQSVIPDDGSVTKIGAYAFGGRVGLTEIIIPDTVTEIGADGFWACSFSKLEIPSSVKSIGEDAFLYCDDLVTLKLNEGLETILYSAFRYCSALREVEIPSSVTDISNYAFDSCTSLSSVKLNEGVIYIHYNAFSYTAITELNIPASTTTIDSEIVAGCTQLTCLTVDSGNQKYHSAGNCIIETATKTLTVGCDASVIPDNGSVTKIGDYAFSCCSFAQLTMPECVTEVGVRAFQYCANLQTLPLTDYVTSVDKQAFSYCDGLVSVNIPNGLSEISRGMFMYCRNLESVTLGDNITYISSSAFRNCINLKTVNIPSSVTFIGSTAFCRCESLESITVPGSATEMGIAIFEYCTALKKVILEEGVQELRLSLFYGCTALEEIVLPKSLSSEKYIGGSAIQGCVNLKTIRYAGTVEEWKSFGTALHHYMPEDCRIICSDGIILKDLTELPSE